MLGNGVLSPVMLIAGSGLIQNQGLAANTILLTNLAAYNSLGVISQFNTVVATALDPASPIGNATKITLQTVGSSTLPALSNSIPSAYTGTLGLTASGGYSGLIQTTANNIMGNNDLSKFSQVFTAATGFISQNNSFVNAIDNLNTLAATFSPLTGGMDGLQTAGLICLSPAFGALGRDLVKIGQVINLSDLRNLGDPSALLKNLINTSGGLPSALQAILRQNGVTDDVLSSLADNQNIADTANKTLYDAMTKVTGNTLDQIKLLFKCDLSQVLTMADFLDPKKIFVESYATLTMPTPNGLMGIYDAQGGVNSGLIPYLGDDGEFVSDSDQSINDFTGGIVI